MHADNESLLTFKLPATVLAGIQALSRQPTTLPILPSTLPFQTLDPTLQQPATFLSTRPSLNPSPISKSRPEPHAQISHVRPIAKSVDYIMVDDSSDSGVEGGSALSDLKSVTPQSDPVPISFTPINGSKVSNADAARLGSSSLLDLPAETPANAQLTPQHSLKNDNNEMGDSTRALVPWTDEEERVLLTWAPFNESHEVQWRFIADQVKTRAPDQCKRRWATLQRHNKAVPIKLEPMTDVTDEMTRVAGKKTVLTATEYDLLWRMGIEKYTNETSWQFVVDTHPRTWPTGAAGPTNVCSKWTEIWMKKWNDLKEHGLQMMAVQDESAEVPTKILPVPNLETFENCPPSLKTRILNQSDLRYATMQGTNPLPKRKAIDLGLTSGGNPSKRTKYSEPFSATQQPGGGSYFQATITDDPAQMHRSYEQKHLPLKKCDWCQKPDHEYLYKCLSCNALFCSKDLDSGQIMHHHLPVASQGKSRSPVAREIMGKIGWDPSYQPTQAWKDATPFVPTDLLGREKRERVAKTKAMDNVHTTYQEHRVPLPPAKSSPRAKKSQIEMRPNTSGKNKSIFQTPAPRSSRPEDDGSSTAFSDDEVQASKAKSQAKTRSPIKRPISRRSGDNLPLGDSDSDGAPREATSQVSASNAALTARRTRPTLDTSNFQFYPRRSQSTTSQDEDEDMHDAVADNERPARKSMMSGGVSRPKHAGRAANFKRDDGYGKACNECSRRKIRCTHRTIASPATGITTTVAVNDASAKQTVPLATFANDRAAPTTSTSVSPSLARVHTSVAQPLQSTSQTPTSLHNANSIETTDDGSETSDEEIVRLGKLRDEKRSRRESRQVLLDQQKALRRKQRKEAKKQAQRKALQDDIDAEDLLAQAQLEEMRKAGLQIE